MLRSRQLSIVLLTVFLIGVASAAPTTRPELRAADLHGNWRLDRDATIEKAVASAPAAKQEQVREELTRALPDQTFRFNADSSYAVATKAANGPERTDAGTYALTEGEIQLKSSGAGGDRSLTISREGEGLLLQGMLVLRRKN